MMKLRMTPKSFVSLFVLLLVAGVIGTAVYLDRPPEPLPVSHSLNSYQSADAPAGYPIKSNNQEKWIPDFDPRFIQLSAFERAAVPEAALFTAPLGTHTGAFSYNAQAFWDLNEKRGGHHSGDDLNGIGGMNTDLGDSVFSVGDGRVLFAGDASSGWGKIVLIMHETNDHGRVQSMYAHLHEVKVATGNVVHRGQKIGSVGTGNGNYLAHLHFEMRAADSVDILRGYLADRGVHLAPDSVIFNYKGEGGRALAPAAAMILDKQRQNERQHPDLKVNE